MVLPKSKQEILAERAAKLEELRRLKEEQATRERLLPHLYGMKFYKWARRFFESRNRKNFLCAANQISKSSTQIRKCIHWATAVALWPSLWPTTPTQFWYLYPDLGVAQIEFETKWKQFLPQGEMKDHEHYGWRVEKNSRGQIHALHFNSGVSVYFKSYEQNVDALQTATVYAMFCDEELPVELYSELILRLQAPLVRGYWHMVFTATKGQEMWRQTIEEIGTKFEMFPEAFKQQVSMYDCLEYEDGSPSPWTKEIIAEVIQSCKSEAEVQRRVYGKFVLDENLQYTGFARSRNFVPGHKVPKNWNIYAGVDIGTGGSAHPAAIAFVAVNPTFTQGRVVWGWRGDRIVTTCQDILDKYIEIRDEKKFRPVMTTYDHQSKDFATCAQRNKPPIPVIPADKSRDSGIGMLNTLFKLDMLKIHDDCPENIKAVLEFEGLKSETAKPNAKDDFIDAIRFAITRIPWNISKARAGKKPAKPDPHAHLSARERERLGYDKREKPSHDATEDEMELANEAYDYDFGGGGDEEFEDY